MAQRPSQPVTGGAYANTDIYPHGADIPEGMSPLEFARLLPHGVQLLDGTSDVERVRFTMAPRGQYATEPLDQREYIPLELIVPSEIADRVNVETLFFLQDYFAQLPPVPSSSLVKTVYLVPMIQTPAVFLSTTQRAKVEHCSRARKASGRSPQQIERTLWLPVYLPAVQGALTTDKAFALAVQTATFSRSRGPQSTLATADDYLVWQVVSAVQGLFGADTSIRAPEFLLSRSEPSKLTDDGLSKYSHDYNSGNGPRMLYLTFVGLSVPAADRFVPLKLPEFSTFWSTNNYTPPRLIAESVQEKSRKKHYEKLDKQIEDMATEISDLVAESCDTAELIDARAELIAQSIRDLKDLARPHTPEVHAAHVAVVRMTNYLQTAQQRAVTATRALYDPTGLVASASWLWAEKNGLWGHKNFK